MWHIPIEGGQLANVEAILRTLILKLDQTKLSMINWVENIYSCSSMIRTLKLMWKDWWLLQGSMVIKVYSKYIGMPLKYLHSIVTVLNVKNLYKAMLLVLKAWSVKNSNV